MLKAVLMDFFPYLVDKHAIFNFIWQNVITDKEYDAYSNDETMMNFLYDDLSDHDVAQAFLNKSMNSPRSLEIINTFDAKKQELIAKFFKEYKFSEVMVKFFNDAKTSDCDVILMNNNPEFSDLLPLIKLPEKVYLSNEYDDINTKNIEEVLTKKSIALNEFIYITNDEPTIGFLLEKGYFCATISDKQDINHDIYVISNIDDLTFGNLALKFYDKSDEEQQGGL